LYLGNGNDYAYLDGFLENYSVPLNSLVYGDDGFDQINLLYGSTVAFGGLDFDLISIGSEVKEALTFGGAGNDFIILAGNPENSYATNEREAYIWSGAGRDVVEQRSLSLVSSSTPFNDWLMDFDSGKRVDGGDAIRFYDLPEGDVPHTWSKDTTELEERYADENHPFLSDGATYYALQAQSATDGNWYSVLNLVGTNGATITLDGLFANGNLGSIMGT